MGGGPNREDNNQYGTKTVTAPGTMQVKIIVLSKITVMPHKSRRTYRILSEVSPRVKIEFDAVLGFGKHFRGI